MTGKELHILEPIYDESSCTCGIDTAVYPLEAVVKSAYLFLDRCYILLYHDAEGTLRVRLKCTSRTRADIHTIVDEFLNELLNQSLRYQIAKETRNLRELIMARALYSECLDTTSFNREGTEEKDEFAEDALDIGKDWFNQQASEAE